VENVASERVQLQREITRCKMDKEKKEGTIKIWRWGLKKKKLKSRKGIKA
jgi:hypothetical protein